MPRDASGTYTPPVNSFYPAQPDTNIDPDDWNQTIGDISLAISQSATNDLSSVDFASVSVATLQAMFAAMQAAGVFDGFQST